MVGVDKDLSIGKDLKVFIDSREYERHEEAERKFKYYHYDVEIKELPYGDYVCGNTVIEYKGASDFWSSITDNRLKRETIEQASNFPYHFVMVVGNPHSALRMAQKVTGNASLYSLKTYYKLIARLSTYTVPIVLPTSKEAFNVMVYLFHYCNSNPRNIVPVDKLNDNPSFNYLRSIKGIGDKRARYITEQLGIYNLKELLKVSYDDLMSVNLIGDTKARLIMKGLGLNINANKPKPRKSPKERKKHFNKKLKEEKQ